MFDVYIRKVIEDGKPIFPSEFCLTDEETTQEGWEHKKSVESLKRQLDNWLFSGQYLNDPVDIDTVEFKPHWFKQFVMDEALSRKLDKAAALMSVDPAFRLKQTNDFSGICVTKTTEDNLVYVLEAAKKKLNPKSLVDEIFRLFQIYKPYKIQVETVSAQIVLIPLLQDEMHKRNVYFTIEEVKPSTDQTKAARIRGLVPHYANGRIFHAPGLKDLENELLEFPRGSHDDIIDALSYQAPLWRGYVTAPAKDEAPYMSLNWWKKQHRPRMTRIGGMFADLMPARR